jgi:hypothetical protein
MVSDGHKFVATGKFANALVTAFTKHVRKLVQRLTPVYSQMVKVFKKVRNDIIAC